MLRARRNTALATAAALVSGVLLVAATSDAGADDGVVGNATALTVPNGAPGITNGAASLYPSTVNVPNVWGPITDVNVTLHSLGHTNPDDLDIVLRSPTGVNVALMSDACGTGDVEDISPTFNDQASSTMADAGDCIGSQFKPSNVDDGADSWGTDVTGPVSNTLSAFNGTSALGVWSLYVVDDTAANVGDLEGGWSMVITTADSDIDIPTSGSADPYPRTLTVSSDQIVTDANLTFTGFTHAAPEQVSVLLVGPSGDEVMLMQDSCGQFGVNDQTYTWDDEAPGLMGALGCSSGFSFKPTNRNASESLPPPAPAAPYGNALSAFDLKPAAGDWKVCVFDDAANGGGYLVGIPSLNLTTRPKADTGFSEFPTQVSEGSPASLTLTRSASGPLGAGRIALVVAPGTGTAEADDLTILDEDVVFAAGETSKTVPLTITNDSLEEGSETFRISLGNVAGDAVLSGPAEVSVTIAASDVVLPDTTLVKGPRSSTKRTAKLKFKATEAATFRCKVDKKAWRPCSSPLRLKNLKVGKHKVLVRATDLVGFVEAKPLKVTWKVLKP